MSSRTSKPASRNRREIRRERRQARSLVREYERDLAAQRDDELDEYEDAWLEMEYGCD